MKLATPSMLAAFALVAGGAGLAHAQQKHDSNAPIDWNADRMEVHDKDHRAILIGNVKAVQQDMTLTADRATANYTGSVANSGGTGSGGGNPQVHRLDANGHVVVTRPNEVAHGEYGIYDLDKRLVTLIGNVTLDRTGPNAGTVRGGRLVINLNTNQANMDGSAVGGNGSAGAGGRVSGRFTVPQHDNDKNSSGTPAAKPATAPKPAQS
ncbi:LptA/OstA family protein [Sphingomonas sp. PR090111-T3T-6A]|uniref:LptA/OstA family protein n=1 Tax=Sphingomonas sp. PR090111-T3T-6A TaxID=685778 RepID=UPI00035F128C|nr:LptA/OstA family protein [Sphingomonas sp. PR090111-T3T-6A]